MTTINRARLEMDYAIAADPACVEPGCRRQLLASSGDRVCAAGHDQHAAASTSSCRRTGCTAAIAVTHPTGTRVCAAGHWNAPAADARQGAHGADAL